jgi:hypothetical protein
VLRGGRTNFEVPGDDWQGGTYGLDRAVQLTEDWGLVSSWHINHLAFGRQIAGSMGVVKLPFECGCDWRDAVSFSLFFDQFTDTRIDTRDGSLYLSQVRAQLGYVLASGVEVGGIYTGPVQEDDDVQFLVGLNPALPAQDGIVRTGESIVGYAAGCLGEVQWTLLGGHRVEPATSIIGGSLRRQFTERLAAFAGATFETDRGNWAVAYGMELALGPAFRGCDWCECSDCAGEWTKRWFQWNARQLTVALPHDFWRALNADGLTDRTQDAIQSALGRFGLRTRGRAGLGVGRTDGRQQD